MDNLINVLDNPSSGIAARFSVEDVPAYFLIDRDRKVIGRFSGIKVGKARMKSLIDETFAKKIQITTSAH